MAITYVVVQVSVMTGGNCIASLDRWRDLCKKFHELEEAIEYINDHRKKSPNDHRHAVILYDDINRAIELDIAHIKDLAYIEPPIR